MTLILTAISKNGLCVCADRKSTKTDGTLMGYINKIYRFKNVPIIIFNSGLNVFNDKSWRVYCEEYERSNRWINYDLYKITQDFKLFMEDIIKGEIEKNFHAGLAKEFTTCLFDFCGKAHHNTNYKMYELFWSYASEGIKFEEPKMGRIAITGTGNIYLEKYYDKNSFVRNNNFWKKLEIGQVKQELLKLFRVAINERNSLGGNEFSDEFDIECVQ